MLKRLLPRLSSQLQNAEQLLYSCHANPWAPWHPVAPELQAGCSLQLSRGAHTVRMVLLQDHSKLGQQGDIVHVKPGYARQTLFPQQIADYALPEVLRQLQAQGVAVNMGSAAIGSGKQRSPDLRQQREGGLQEILEVLESKHIVASRRASWRHEEGSPHHLVGPVTPRQVSELVAQQMHIDLPPQLVLMAPDQPLRAFGTYRVPLDLFKPDGRQVELTVEVRRTYKRT